jgi:hypothetical protein
MHINTEMRHRNTTLKYGTWRQVRPEHLSYLTSQCERLTRVRRLKLSAVIVDTLAR